MVHGWQTADAERAPFLTTMIVSTGYVAPHGGEEQPAAADAAGES